MVILVIAGAGRIIFQPRLALGRAGCHVRRRIATKGMPVLPRTIPQIGQLGSGRPALLRYNRASGSVSRRASVCALAIEPVLRCGRSRRRSRCHPSVRKLFTRPRLDHGGRRTENDRPDRSALTRSWFITATMTCGRWSTGDQPLRVLGEHVTSHTTASSDSPTTSGTAICSRAAPSIALRAHRMKACNSSARSHFSRSIDGPPTWRTASRIPPPKPERPSSTILPTAATGDQRKPAPRSSRS